MRTISTLTAVTALAGLAILAGCLGTRHAERISGAETAFLSGDFPAALALSEEVIREMEAGGKPADGKLYYMAGISANETGAYSKSLEYLLKAEQMEYPGEEVYLYLARNFREIDNLSKEISALRAYLTNFPLGREAGKTRDRLFETCMESEDFGLAGKLWSEMDSASRENPGNMETWMQLNRMQGNDRICDSLAARILTGDPENEPALECLGKSYFWKAENLYQHHMKAYREDRTYKQYALLLEAFKQVSADFIKSLEYFLKLYDLNPDPAYASYLGNIYTRLEDREKASFYKKKAD